MIENTTPKPNVVVNTKAVKPSKIPFVINTSWSPLIPLSKAPNIAIAPTTKISEAVTMACDTFCPSVLDVANLAPIHKPSSFNLSSKFKNYPIKTPVKILNNTIMIDSVGNAINTAIETNTKHVPYIIVYLHISSIIITIIPNKQPTKIHSTYIPVHNNAIIHLLYLQQLKCFTWNIL